MPRTILRRCAAFLIIACLTAMGAGRPALAGSDFDTFVFPADYAGLGLPADTLVLSQYLGYINSDAFNAPGDNIYAKLNGPPDELLPRALRSSRRRISGLRGRGGPFAFAAVLPGDERGTRRARRRSELAAVLDARRATVD